MSSSSSTGEQGKKHKANACKRAFWVNDRIGRIWATRELCIVWIVGIILFMTSGGNLGQLYAGRFIAGVGIGQTTVIAPTYLAEISPRAVRGLAICVFSGSVYLGIMLGYFASWGCSIHISNNSGRQWIIPTSMHIIFAGIIFILTLFAKESPRLLIKKGNLEKATENMCWLRRLSADDLYVQTELRDISVQLEHELESTANIKYWGLGALKEICLEASNRYRIMLVVMAQLLGQWSVRVPPILDLSWMLFYVNTRRQGGGAITVYAPEFFALLGKTGQSEKLFATAIFGVVKFVSAIICALFLVDALGRKRALGTGIVLQFISMLYVASYLAAVPAVQKLGAHLSTGQKHAGTGAVVMIYISGVGWALGWNSIQYLVNAEIFPLRIRSLGVSIAMVVHFANQYGNSKAVPEMLVSRLKPQGTFFFFAAVTALGFIWQWFLLPETTGKSLESMDAMFQLPWYVIGRKGAALTKGVGTMAEAYDAGTDLDKEKIEHPDHEESVEERTNRV